MSCRGRFGGSCGSCGGGSTCVGSSARSCRSGQWSGDGGGEMDKVTTTKAKKVGGENLRLDLIDQQRVGIDQ